jgi:hypothetical protein
MQSVTITDVPFLISLDPITFRTNLLRSILFYYFPYVSADLQTLLLRVPVCGCDPLMNSDSL